MSEIKVPVSPGELLDKITILRIKSQRMSDPAKWPMSAPNCAPRSDLDASAYAKIDIEADVGALMDVNERLWMIEDDIRDCERAQAFDAEFIRLARAVYVERRARGHQAPHQYQAGIQHHRREVLPAILISRQGVLRTAVGHLAQPVASMPDKPWGANSIGTFPAWDKTAAGPPPLRCIDAARSAESIDASNRLGPSPACHRSSKSNFERFAPDFNHAVAHLRIGSRLDHPLSLRLERQVMQHGAVADVGLRQAPRPRARNDARRRQPSSWRILSVYLSSCGWRRRGQHPVLHQKLDVRDTARVLLDVELRLPCLG